MLAVLMPCASFYSRGRKGEAFLCLLMQATLVGWVPASIWACGSVSEEVKKHRIERVLRSVKQYTVMPSRQAGSTAAQKTAMAEME